MAKMVFEISDEEAAKVLWSHLNNTGVVSDGSYTINISVEQKRDEKGFRVILKADKRPS